MRPTEQITEQLLRSPEMKMRSPRTLSRRRFLEAMAAGLGMAVLSHEGVRALEEINKNTEFVYSQQNKEILLNLLNKSDTIDPHFGVVADPRRSASETIARLSEVRKGVGQLAHVGYFTKIEDLLSWQGTNEFLTTLKMIDGQDAVPFIALGGGNPIDGHHMLAPESSAQLEGYLENVVKVLRQYGKPVVIRFLFEMNTYNFGYSRNQLGISDVDQIRGFQRAVKSIDTLLKKYDIRQDVKLMFNPTCWQPFTQYASDKKALACFDLFGLDLYDFSLFKGVYIGKTLLPPGKVSPFEVMHGSMKELHNIASKKEVMIGEFGSFGQDVQWMQQMVLLLLANNVNTISYFDSDERPKHELFEGDFRITPEMMMVFRKIFTLIQTFQNKPLTRENLDTIQSCLLHLRIPLSLNDICSLHV